MKKFKVIVTVELVDFASPEDAEIDDEDVRDHEYEIAACCERDAEEKALDQFHDTVAIGCLDYVEISTKVEAL